MSAHVFQISDGTTTKSFISSNDMKLVRYQPLTSLNGEDVTERFLVNFTSKTPATNAANINTINRLFEQARNYANTEMGAKVYAGFDPGTSGTTWRSLIRNGRVILNDEVLATRQYDQTLQLEIEWTRQGFWEGALTAVPLTNTSDTDNTTGMTVYNHDDDGVCQVETAVIVGTITGDGNAAFTVTATGMDGSPITEQVAVLTDDTPTEVATKAAAQLNTNGDISGMFDISSSGANLVLTKWDPAANDVNLNIAYTNNGCTGLTPDASSDNTVAGSVTPHENWVRINDEDVTGDLPAPIKIQMFNSKASFDPTDEIYIFHNVHSTPFSFDHILGGNSASYGGTGAAIADTTCQDGFYGNLQWAATTETLLATWTLSATNVRYAKGGRFAILARWQADFPYTNVWFKFKLYLTGSSTDPLWEGNLSLIPDTRQLHAIDTFRLPPYLAGVATVSGLLLKLYATRATAGTHTVPLDYIQLSPIAGEGGWKRFVCVDIGLENYLDHIMYDETEGYTYYDGGSGVASTFTEYGGPIMLIPNADQKLYFSSCDNSGDAHIDQTWIIKVWYRPRRSSL